MTVRQCSSKVGVLSFPGSNCEEDCVQALSKLVGSEILRIRHDAAQLPKVDRLIIPGGFSYGDYLRSGALAAHAPVMGDVRRFAKSGGPILGICNGFQILTEAELLPGVLLRNKDLHFICNLQRLHVSKSAGFYNSTTLGPVLEMPIAHGDGRYFASQTDLSSMRDNGQIVLKYAKNPNGSLEDIAGICSKDGRIFGLMPHPERRFGALTQDNSDGIKILSVFLSI